MSKVITTLIDSGCDMMTVREFCEVPNIVSIGITNINAEPNGDPHLLSRSEFYDMIKDVERVMGWTNKEENSNE